MKAEIEGKNHKSRDFLSQALDNSQVDLLSEKLADPAHDAFGYQQIADKMARILRQASPPFVYAICGKWGTGKSSLLKFLVSRLPRPEDGAATVYFNAWRSSIHKDILAKFVFSLTSQLEESAVVKPKLINRPVLKESLEILAIASIEALSDLNIATRLFSGVYKKARERQLEAFKGMLAAELKVREHFARISSQLANIGAAGVTVYVIIDELDRCSPTDVVRVIEAVRMVFCGPDELANVVSGKEEPPPPFKFIISIDPEYVASAFSNHYGLTIADAHAYVSKFIQYKYTFPAKRWKRFSEDILVRFGEKESWLPPGSSEDLSNLLSHLELESPREAGRILIYLLMWQKQLYGEGEGSVRVEDTVLSKASELGDSAEAVTAAAFRLTNLALAMFAFVVAEFPSEAETLVHNGLFPLLPKVWRGGSSGDGFVRFVETGRLEASAGGLERPSSRELKEIARRFFQCLLLFDRIVESLEEENQPHARDLAAACVYQIFET